MHWGKWLVGMVLVAAVGHVPGMAETIVDEGKVSVLPWSGYWWPFQEGGLTGPLAKYDRLTGRRAVRWEERNGRADPQAPPWHGYCHAVAAAGVMEPEPRQRGTLQDARRREPFMITVGDQKGWLTACHTADVAEIHGDRFGDKEGPEDPADIAPDQLWHLLRLYIRDRGVPVVLDIEPGPEVWNYPVFAYRLVSRPDEAAGRFRAELTLWMADNSVPPDFVGLQVRKQTYTFSFRMEGGAVVMGSGRWTGLSRQDHPDFAWYPYAAVAENPEIDYDRVKELLTRLETSAPTEPSGEGQDRPEPPRPPEEPTEPTPPPSPPGPQPEVTVRPPEAPAPPVLPSGGAPPVLEESLVLSPQELVALVTARTSSFKFDVTVDRFDGAEYRPGETYSIVGATAEKGYLYIFLIDPSCELRLLYPQLGQENDVDGAIKIPKPGDILAFRVPDQPGLYRLKAVITRKPIRMVGLLAERDRHSGQPTPSRRAQSREQSTAKGCGFHWHPASRKLVRDILTAYTKGHEPAEELRGLTVEALGGFAQDEVAFYVAATPQSEQKSEQ